MTDTFHTHQARLSIETGGHGHMHDVTDRVAEVICDSAIRTGVAHVFNIGSTGAVGTIEFEAGLAQDLPETLDRLIPPSRDYGHERAWHDGNGHSHLQATVLGPGLSLPVAEGRLVRGAASHRGVDLFRLHHRSDDRLRRHRPANPLRAASSAS